MSRAFTLAELVPFAASGAPRGKPGKQIDAELSARLDLTPTVARCVFCDWSFSGSAVGAREAGVAHRLEWHPGVGSAPGRRARERARAEELARRRAAGA